MYIIPFWKSFFSKYKLSEIENYHSSISIRKLKEERKRQRDDTLSSQVKFQRNFHAPWITRMVKLDGPIGREEWNLARLILEF